MDFIDELANNDLFLTLLIVILIVLVITFFLVLFFSGKKSKVKEVSNNLNKEDEFPTIAGNDINFDHDDYVKEATLEFELSPVQDVKAVLNEIKLDKIEESPAYHVDDNKSLEPTDMKNFSFDELSKMISEELDNLDKEDKIEESISTPQESKVEEAPKVDASIPKVTFVDSFKTIEEEPIKLETPVEKTEPLFKEEAKTSFDSVLINKVVQSNDEKEFDLPKLADNAKSDSEAVIKENDVPLYARFNQESYNLNQKD